MAEYMNAPPPVYTAGPKNGTNGANVGGYRLFHQTNSADLNRLNVDWV